VVSHGVGLCGGICRAATCHSQPLPTPRLPEAAASRRSSKNCRAIFADGGLTSASARPRRCCAPLTSGSGDGCAPSSGSSGRTRFQKLRQRGVGLDLAACTAASAHGPWRLANSPAAGHRLPQCFLRRARLGFPHARQSAQSAEPPYTDPYVRWCGRGEVVRLPPIPITTASWNGQTSLVGLRRSLARELAAILVCVWDALSAATG
jgi:hypothetical protein